MLDRAVVEAMFQKVGSSSQKKGPASKMFIKKPRTPANERLHRAYITTVLSERCPTRNSDWAHATVSDNCCCQSFYLEELIRSLSMQARSKRNVHANGCSFCGKSPEHALLR